MTEQEAFKIGFLLFCADAGMSPAQTAEHIEKAAGMHKRAAGVGETASNFVSGVGSGIGTAVATAAGGLSEAAKWLLGNAKLSLIGGPLAGLLGGYALANMNDDTFDVDEAKKQEEIAEYRRAIDQLSRSNRLRAVA